ncbi:hypothetical protein LI291_10755 [Intestinibacillus massiliensis]|nr:hypothetical protein [Intestinibacillus massiliensis]
MIDVESAIFSTVATAFTAAYPNGSRYGEQVDTPAKFPCLTLVEIDNATYQRSQDTAITEHHAAVIYELDCYSNKTSGAKQECKNIMALADQEMQQMGFTRLFCNQTKNMDSKIYRMTARYTGVISENYQIYRR